MATVEQVAAIYARQSHGRERSIDEQIADCRKACEQQGWQPRDPYSDRVSASRFSSGDRPGWTRLLADLEAGRFGVLVLWESSRGDRDLETWAGLLKRCRMHGVRIHVVNHGHTYDLTRNRDWRTLAEDGVDSEYESGKTSERLQRGAKASVLSGRPHGAVNYGYRRIYDERTRELVRQEAHPDQAPVIQEIIGRIAQNVPVKTITEGLNARGIPSPHGGEWSRTVVRRLALNPVYISKRIWEGEFFDGNWPPLIDEITFWRATRRLNDPLRKTTRPGSQKHLLSYLARCGECGKPLWMYRQGRRKPMYACSSGRGCVYIDAESLEVFVRALVTGKLHSPVFWEAMLQGAEDDAEVASARAEAGTLRARLDGIAVLAATGEISARSLAIAEQELTPKIAEAESRAQRAALPAQLVSMPPIEEWRDAFGEMPVRMQRSIIRLVVVIEVMKPARRTTKFDPARIKITWLH